MKSTPCSRPNSTMSRSSFSVTVGSSTTMPGRFMFLRSPSVALLVTVTSTELAGRARERRRGRVRARGARTLLSGQQMRER